MTSIHPQVSLKKEVFIFGVNTHFEGTILLPGVDISTLKKIEIKHLIEYGISDKEKNPTEDFSRSKQVNIGVFPVDMNTLTFSIPIVYPNIHQTNGDTLDEYYSIIKNRLIIAVSEHGFFNFPHKTTIYPTIEWPILSQEDERKRIIKEEGKKRREQKNTNEPNESLEEIIQGIFPNSIMLPWSLLDTISKEYYNNILTSFPFAKLGDILYRNKILIGIRKFGYMTLFLSIMAIGIVGKDPEFVGYPFILLLIVGGYLIIEYIPRKYLQKKMDIRKYGPKIQSRKNIQSSLQEEKFTTQSFFLPYQEGFENPVTGVKGTLMISLMFTHEFAYQSGKSTITHHQFLINKNIASIEFDSLERVISDKNLILPSWACEIIHIPQSSNIGLKKELFISINYETLPDIDYTVSLL